jgi:L-histidine N-alpha-methyltransferase
VTKHIEIYVDADDIARDLRTDAREGLSATPKVLPPKWFYDERGSELFELITKLPEYYPTRAEREVLTERAAEIAAIVEAKVLVELGSGSSDKTRLLLDALHRRGTLATFVPLDVSESALRAAASAINAEYDDLDVHGIVADFTAHLDRIPQGRDRLVAFLGGTIGNFEPAARAGFLASLREVLEPGEWLLLGTDLVKDPATLVAAYDDAQGITAEFNRNVLRVLNRELDGDFDVDAFSHVAKWEPEHEWIEMRLRADRAQSVRLAGLDLELEFAEGEQMRTEVSAKFRREGIEKELRTAGFELEHWWTDSEKRFGVSLARSQ